MMKNIRANEWVKDGEDGWFNGYYDNHGRKVEGVMDESVRMMLTGQVFAIMSGTATEDQVESICRSAAVSYTHLDVYKRQDECRGPCNDSSACKQCGTFAGD